MFFDGQLGARSEPLPACECLHGTAVIDGNGNCRCINDSIINNPQTNSPKNPQIVIIRDPNGFPYINNPQTNPTTTTVPVEDDTILGMPKWIAIIGGIGVGLYFVSQMGEK